MKRRLFLATPALLAAALSADGRKAVRGPAPSSAAGAGRLQRVAATAFGTTVSLAGLDDGSPAGRRRTRAALQAAMREVQDIDAIFSLFRAQSQLSALNRDGRLDGAHPHLLRNLRFAQQLSARTGGAFDATVQPLWELFARARQQRRLPEAQEIAAARALVGYRALRLADGRAELARPGAKVTLNSLAQGYAVDVVVKTLQCQGVDAALVDTGELGSLGQAEGARPWTVGLQHPRERGAFIALLAMDGRVVSTSGDYATAFSSDFRHHHIFDPATGLSPPGFASTVVLASSGLVADGLSTALMVLDRAAGERLVRSYPGADAVWIDKQGRMQATAGVPFA